MNKIWHKFPDEKPEASGYYATIEKFGDISNMEWDERTQEFACNALDVVRYWAYFEDVIPEYARQTDGFMWKERGKKE